MLYNALYKAKSIPMLNTKPAYPYKIQLKPIIYQYIAQRT